MASRDAPDRMLAAATRKAAFAQAHPGVAIIRKPGPAAFWEASQVLPDGSVRLVREKDLERFADRIEAADWDAQPEPELTRRGRERGLWWDAARKWESPWGVGRRPR